MADDLISLLGGSPDEVDFAMDEVRNRLSDIESSPRDRLHEKMLLAALESIPWIGGYLAAYKSAKLETGDVESDRLQTLWLEGLRRKLELLRETLVELSKRIEGFESRVDERIQSEGFLQIVRKAFRTWDSADTSTKRRYASTLVANAAGSRVCSDDVVRLFIEWLDKYNEMHFAVISHVFNHSGSTRRDVWTSLYGEVPRDDSAEAGLFRRLIRDLSFDGVIQNERPVTAEGHYARKAPQKTSRPAPKTLESVFDNPERLELTPLGKQFVHYTMNEAIAKLDSGEHPN